MNEWILFVIYLVFMNVIGFCIMGVDKRRAKLKKWRIEEKTLFIIAILGGSIGSLIGMNVFRHKTKHKKFTIGMPLIILLQSIILFQILMN